MKLKAVITDWDVKDIRNLIIAILLLIVPVYFQTVTAYVLQSIVTYISLFSTKAINFLYRNAAEDPAHYATLNIFCFALIAFALFITLPIKNQRSNVRDNTSLPLQNLSIEKLKRKLRLMYAAMWAARIFTILFCSMLYVSIAFPIIINDSFHKRINIVSPYISEHDRLILLSKWSLMSNQKDYEDIQAALASAAKAGGLVLP